MSSTEDVAEPQEESSIWGWLIPTIIIGLLILAVFLLFNRFRANARLLKPFAPTQTPNALQVEYAPIALDFAELGEDPVQFRDQRIQVTGRFSKIALPDCHPYSGPLIEWGLVVDSLQMNAIGYEAIVRSLPENTEMTVEGVWTFYDGGVGCGKESREQNGVWYLKVEHILQPNPIVRGNSETQTQLNVAEEDGSTSDFTPEANATEIGDNSDATPQSDATETPDSDSGATATSTPTLVVNGTPKATTSSTTPEATEPPTSTPVLAPTEEVTADPDSTNTPSSTPTATAVSGETETPPPTPTIDSPGNPPAPTATPGDGYPPPGGGGYP